MNPILKYGAGVALLLLAATVQPVQAEIYFDGGFVIEHKGTAEERSVPPGEYRWSYLLPRYTYSYPAAARRPANGATSYRSFYTNGAPRKSRPEFPWMRTGFRDYDEEAPTARDQRLVIPRKYHLRQKLVLRGMQAARPNTMVLVAHLPESASLWIEGRLTSSTGRLRSFKSPALDPAKNYTYTVLAVWFEDGHWARQALDIPVRAGELHALYLEREAAAESEDRVAAGSEKAQAP